MAGIITDLQLIDADTMVRRVPMADAIAAVQRTLRGVFDPDDDAPRAVVDVPHGQLLLMPAAVDGGVGQKLASVAPGDAGAVRRA